MDKSELFNSVTHIFGAAAAFVGLLVLIIIACGSGDPVKITSCAIYGGTLLLLYTFSSLYHSTSGRKKIIFRIFDHQSIYLLIAGTYTPFMLVTLRGALGWSLFAVVWGLAVLGIILELFPQKGKRVLPLVLYLGMGWMLMAAIGPLRRALPDGGLSWLLAGGIFYTSGVVFYGLDKRVRYFHGVWHLFVLAGSVSHYFAVLFYVL